MRRSNPAALAWMLVLGHEARVSSDDEREVKQMSNPIDVTTWTIGDCVEQLESCGYECEAGTLKNNVAYKRILDVHDEQAARIAELEAQLAAAQGRERENVRLLAECNRILDAEFPYSTRSLRAEIAAALAAAQPASDGGKGEA